MLTCQCWSHKTFALAKLVNVQRSLISMYRVSSPNKQLIFYWKREFLNKDYRRQLIADMCTWLVYLW